MIRGIWPAPLGAVALSLCLWSADAHACGGCFHPYDLPPENASVVVAHRMALAVSLDQTVLWDQVQYAGSPEEFAWVLPVKPGATIEVASDAWFETLEAATGVRVTAPPVSCVTTASIPGTDGRWVEEPYGNELRCQMAGSSPGLAMGCAADDRGAGMERWEEGTPPTDEEQIVELPPDIDPVEVVHAGSVGPYETVTLSSNEPGAITTWLSTHGFAIGDDVQPIIDAYEDNGFDFIALRLLPEQGVQQMKPVRIVQPGASPSLPLQMVAAGTGASVSLTLFVIGEGRYQTDNFPSAVMPHPIVWDFGPNQSSYAELREIALGEQGGRSWLTSYARRGALLSPVDNPVTSSASQYVVGGVAHTAMADAYVHQALLNGETDEECVGSYAALAGSTDKVVEPCDPDTGLCSEVGPGEIDARVLGCGELDDLRVALTGMHPGDVWVTRLEADLPRAALDVDLELGAALEQAEQDNWIRADDFVNAPCEVAGALPPRSRARGPSPWSGGGYALGLCGVAWLLWRRRAGARRSPGAWSRAPIAA